MKVIWRGVKTLYKTVYDILYESNCYIWVYTKEKNKILKNLGLQYLVQYEVNHYLWDINIERKNYLDINLGYTFDSIKGKYPGIVMYGEEKEDNYKIAMLGDSTTDGLIYLFKAWPELLYEEIGGNRVIVYNGGVGGYVSGQQLIKFIRDMLLVQPDMVIVYGGYTDVGVTTQYPFAFAYAKTVFDYVKTNMPKGSNMEDSKIIYSGIESRANVFENWLSNIRCMYAIAKERNIKFYTFCQPWLGSKNEKSIKEKNLMLSMRSKELSFRMKNSFRRYMSQKKDIPNYIYDLSHIFDEKDVYIDYVHVWEEENRIIAEAIKQVILPEIEAE